MVLNTNTPEQINDILLSQALNSNTIDTVGALDKIMTKLKEKEYVLQNHKSDNGKQLKITYLAPTTQYPNGRWQTKSKSRKNIYGNSYDDLIHKLFLIYDKSNNQYIFKDVFNKAIDNNLTKGINTIATIQRYQYDYKRYINDELANKDIRQVTLDYLERYTIALVTSQKMSEKAFKNYKGILNLVFNYYDDVQNPLKNFNNNVYSRYLTTKSSDDRQIECFTLAEIEKLKAVVAERRKTKQFGDYYINSFVMRLAILTGMRVGELCALHWSDIHWDKQYIHIHRQQLSYKQKGGRVYYEANWLKNEKGKSKGGRKFPLTNEISDLLIELKDLQEKYGYKSKYIFTNKENEWVKADAYITFLRTLCKSLNFTATHNHAFRKALNSYVFVPKGIQVADRAQLLGHSVETNLKYYTLPNRDMINDAKKILDNA